MRKSIVVRIILILISITLLTAGVLVENPLRLVRVKVTIPTLINITTIILLVGFLVATVLVLSILKYCTKSEKDYLGVVFRLTPKTIVSKDDRDTLELQLKTLLNILKEYGITYTMSITYNAELNSTELILVVWSYERQIEKIVNSIFKIICKNWSIEKVKELKDISAFKVLGLKSGFSLTNVKRVFSEKLNTPSHKLFIDITVNTVLTMPLLRLRRSRRCNSASEYTIKLNELEVLKPLACSTVVELSMEQLLRHVGIFGTTGSGKSTTAAVLLKNIYRELNIPIIILDWHNEYTHILDCLGVREVYVHNPSGLRLNPLYRLEKDTIDEIVDIFASTLELSNPQSYYLQSALEYMLKNRLKPSLQTLQYILNEKIYEVSHAGREALCALLRKISFIARMFNKEHSDSEVDYYIENVLFKKGIHIINLASIRSLQLRRLYALLALRIIYEKLISLGITNRLRVVIVLEEAHNIFTKDNVFPAILVPEVRKYGLGFIVISQSLSILPQQVLSNINTVIVHTLISRQDKRVLSEMYEAAKEVLDTLSNLALGEAYIFTINNPSPTPLRVTLNYVR